MAEDADGAKHAEHLKQLEKQWSNPLFPAGYITAENALLYFGDPDSNPFYDRRCTNERVKQSNQGVLDLKELKKQKGIEYALVHSQEPVLHVVAKQMRLAPTREIPKAFYYIARGYAYQAPDLSTVISTRVRSAAHQMKQALEIASAEAVRADQHGYSWKFLAKEARASLGMASKYRRNPLLERGATGTDEHALYYTANRRIKELEEKWPLPRPAADEAPAAEVEATRKRTHAEADGEPAAKMAKA